MYLRDVLKRWRERPGDVVEAGSANSCLLGELAADPEDFAELAAVLHVDLRAVVAALSAAEPPRSVELLVAALTATHESIAAPVRARSSWGRGGEEVGWARWVRVPGGARTHREAAAHETVVRPARVAS
jgi:hypothetical protein